MNDVTFENVRMRLQLRNGAQQRKRPRLAEFDYVGAYAYHVELTVQRRRPVLAEATWTGSGAKSLSDVAAVTEFDVLVYCFMPDHLHLLVESLKDHANLLKFVQRFKQLTSFEYKKR